MAKTDDWRTFRSAKIEIQVTAAMVTALASLTTAEWIDLSSIFPGPLNNNQPKTRESESTNVSGDTSPILSVGPGGTEQYTFTFLYTEGEVLGTDNLDLYQDILKPVMDTEPVLIVPFRYSPAGGATGDNLYTFSSTGTYIMSVTPPVGGVTANKIMITVVVETENVTVSTI